MKTLHVQVNNKIATYSKRDGAIVCGNGDYQIQFTFDSDWDASGEKTARFIWNGTHKDVKFSGNVCPVPPLKKTQLLQVGVYTDDTETTTAASIPCLWSVLCQDTTEETTGGTTGGATKIYKDTKALQNVQYIVAEDGISFDCTETDTYYAESLSEVYYWTWDDMAQYLEIQQTEIEGRTLDSVYLCAGTSYVIYGSEYLMQFRQSDSKNTVEELELVHTTGDREDAIMDQKTVTALYQELLARIEKLEGSGGGEGGQLLEPILIGYGIGYDELYDEIQMATTGNAGDAYLYRGIPSGTKLKLMVTYSDNELEGYDNINPWNELSGIGGGVNALASGAELLFTADGSDIILWVDGCNFSGEYSHELYMLG